MFNVHHSQKGKKPSDSIPIATNTNETLFRDNSVIGTTGPNFLQSQKNKAEGIEPHSESKLKRKDIKPSQEPKTKIPKTSYTSKEKKSRKRTVGDRKRLKNYL